MKQPANEAVLSFDFSLDKLDVALRGPDGRWPIEHQAFVNNWAGFQALKERVLAYLQQADDEVQLTAVGESTALYWWHAFYQLATDPDFAPYSPQLVLLNPMHVKHFRQSLPERDKEDPADTRLIDRYYQVNGVKHGYRFDERYLPLRHLTRAYCRLSHTLAAQKTYCLTLLYLLASEYARRKPFADRFGVTSQHILADYPDVGALADIPIETLSARLNEVARGTLKDPADNAGKLHQVARDSYPFPDALRPTVHTVLTLTLDHIRFLEAQKQTYRQLIETELANFPEAQLALQESGLGPILVAGLLAEIQDTRRFITGRKYDRRRRRWRPRKYRDGQAAIARLAGLWWPKHSSGRFVGQDRHLARERNPYLRYWFVQAAYCLKGHQADFASYYWKKYREVPKHQHKRALILTARKAVRLVFALLHKGQRRQLEEAPQA